MMVCFFFFFQAEDGIRDYKVTGVQTCALPISHLPKASCTLFSPSMRQPAAWARRSEEHTSELQSPCNLVCRLLLEKKNAPPPLLRQGRTPCPRPATARCCMCPRASAVPLAPCP